MRNTLTAGAVAGLIAGVMFGLMMQMMSAPTPDGTSVPMMAMVAQVVGSGSLAVGWLYHLFNSALIGAIFAWLVAHRGAGTARLAALGAGYGFVWWVLGGLILMPLLLGMPAFAPLRMAPMFPVAMGSLVGHLIYGALLGAALAWLGSRTHPPVLQAHPRT